MTTASQIKRGAVLLHPKTGHMYVVTGVRIDASSTTSGIRGSDHVVSYEALDIEHRAKTKYNLDGFSRYLDEFDDLCLIGEAGEYRLRFEYIRQATAAEMADVCGGDS